MCVPLRLRREDVREKDQPVNSLPHRREPSENASLSANDAEPSEGARPSVRTFMDLQQRRCEGRRFPGRPAAHLIREILSLAVDGGIEKLAERVEKQEPRQDGGNNLEPGVMVLDI